MGYETTVLGHSREAFLAIELVAILFLAAGIVVASVLADRTGAGRMLARGFAGTIEVGFMLGPVLGSASVFVVWLLDRETVVLGKRFLVYGNFGCCRNM